MEIKSALSVISGFLFVIGFVPYIKSIIKRETKPAKASWIVWASIDSITLAGMYAEHKVNGQIIGATAGAWLVVAFALKFGVPGWSKIDKYCLAGAALGIALWKYFSNPELGIVAGLSAGFVGAIPTFEAAWKSPDSENKLAWTIFWISCACAMIAIPHLTFVDVAQPTVFFLVESIMMYILIFRKASTKQVA